MGFDALIGNRSYDTDAPGRGWLEARWSARAMLRTLVGMLKKKTKHEESFHKPERACNNPSRVRRKRSPAFSACHFAVENTFLSSWKRLQMKQRTSRRFQNEEAAPSNSPRWPLQRKVIKCV